MLNLLSGHELWVVKLTGSLTRIVPEVRLLSVFNHFCVFSISFLVFPCNPFIFSVSFFFLFFLYHLQHGQQLYRHIYLGCKEEDNVHKNFELLFTTLAILTIELANEEVVIDLIRLSITLQVKFINLCILVT